MRAWDLKGMASKKSRTSQTRRDRRKAKMSGFRREGKSKPVIGQRFSRDHSTLLKTATPDT